MYERFAKWHKESFEPLHRQRMRDDLLYDQLSLAIDSYQTLIERKEELQSLEKNMVVARLAELIGTRDGTKTIRTVFDGIRAMGESKELDALWKKTRPQDRVERSIAFSTPFHTYRLEVSSDRPVALRAVNLDCPEGSRATV